MIAVDTNVLVRILVEDKGQNNRAFIIQNFDNFDKALETFCNSNADFSDCLILAESLQQRVDLYTFDKRLSRQKGAKIVS